MLVEGAGAPISNLIALTIWTYIVLTLHLWIACGLVIYGYITSKNESRQHASSVSSQTELTKEIELSSSVNYGTDNPIGYNNVKASDPEIQANPSEHDLESVQEVKSLPVISKVSWILSDIVSVFAIIVTTIYWFAIYPSVQTDMDQTPLSIYMDLNVHALNSLFLFVEIVLSARPVRILHIIYPMIYGLIYVMFALIYWLQDKQNHVIYNVLDFNHPGVVLLTVLGLALIVIPLLQLLHFGIYRLKLFLKHRTTQNI